MSFARITYNELNADRHKYSNYDSNRYASKPLCTRTCDASVRGLEVSHEVLAARLHTEQLGVRHRDETTRLAAAAQLDVIQHISETPDVVVHRQTSTHLYGKVTSM